MITKINSLEDVSSLIKQRIIQDKEDSYVAKLAKSPISKVAQKVGEEGVEVALASLNYSHKLDESSKSEFVGELCDLFFHSLVLMEIQGVELSDIMLELSKRNNKR
jgi:phosphoribosyl-ATP pyrophosphohydrolase/phosphoribosyl-AMP cyclohydrolase